MFHRFASARLRRLAQGFPVVVLTGPRQSGKTTLARAAMPGHAYVSLEDPDVRQRVAADPPDLILLDVMMPKKSGLEVCQAVRADDTLAGVQIVLLTAKGRDTDVAQGLGVGANAYVTKPFSTKDLAAKVRQMLSG